MQTNNSSSSSGRDAYAELNGVRLDYREQGNGPLIRSSWSGTMGAE